MATLWSGENKDNKCNRPTTTRAGKGRRKRSTPKSGDEGGHDEPNTADDVMEQLRRQRQKQAEKEREQQQGNSCARQQGTGQQPQSALGWSQEDSIDVARLNRALGYTRHHV